MPYRVKGGQENREKDRCTVQGTGDGVGKESLLFPVGAPAEEEGQLRGRPLPL